MRKAERISNVPPYLFARIDAKKDKLKEQGIDVIDLGVGDPDMPTPDSIVNEMKKMLDDPKTLGYPPYKGIPEFKKAVAVWYKKRFNVDLNPEDEVISLIGSKEGIAHILFAFVDPGDVALIPDPCYPVYRVATILAGGTPVSMPLLEKNGFLPDFDAIDKKTLSKAKLMFLNYPNNPTAAIADKSFFEKAVKFAKENNILICSDLAYSEIAYDGYKPMSMLEIPGAKDVCIEFHSLSKTYNMTGWRIGMAVGSKEAVSALAVIKTNVDSGIFMAIQYAAIKALSSDNKFINKLLDIYSKRIDIFVKGLNDLGWDIKKPKAAFYIWAKVPKGETSESFCAKVLEKAAVLLVPGSGYGQSGEGYFRASITVSDDRLKEAVNRLKKAGIRFN